MIEPSRPQFQTTAQSLAAANARHDLEQEPLPYFTSVKSNLVAFGAPKSGFCKYQIEWTMMDGSVQKYPEII